MVAKRKHVIQRLAQTSSVTVLPAEPFPHKCEPTVGHRDLLDVLFGIREGCGFTFTLTRRGTRQAQVNGRAQPIHPIPYNETVVPAEPFPHKCVPTIGQHN